jgi:transposase-like protein
MTIDLTDPIFTDERKAREYFELIRWPDGKPFCPHCGCVDKVYRLEGKKHRAGLIHCNNCEGSFTVMTKTPMESSHIPLTKWALGFRLLSGAKKGMSAHQLHRTLGIAYRSAWFMAMRIREFMRDVSGDKLGGAGKIVEADETYVGGKPRKGTPGDGRKTVALRKVPVAVLVERGGKVKATPVEVADRPTLQMNIVAKVERGTSIYTDEANAYQGVHRVIGGLHLHVSHNRGEYAKEDIHNNTAESWNSLLKRSIVGSFHHVSPEHLARYCDEVSFRWDRREMNDTDRTASAIKNGEGKRLKYRWPR